MELKIFNSILLGELRPWQPENQNKKVAAEILTSSFKTPTTIDKYFQSIIEVRPNLKPLFVMDDLQVYSHHFGRSENKEINTPLIEVIGNEPTSIVQQFYHYLIQNEATRIINSILKVAFDKLDKVDAKSIIKGVERNVGEALKDTIAATKSDRGQTSYYVLETLKLHLVRIALEFTSIFSKYIDHRFNINEFFAITLKTKAPQKERFNYTLKFYSLKAQMLVKENGSNTNTLLDFLNSMKNDDPKFGNLYMAIENAIYLKSNSSIGFNFSQISSQSFALEQFIDQRKTFKELINAKNLGFERLEVVNDLLGQVEALNLSLNRATKSIPEKLYNWLLEQKQIYLENSNKTYPVIENSVYEGEEIRKLLGNGDIDEAIEILERLMLSKRNEAEITQTKSRWNILCSDHRKGVVAYEDFKLTQNQITSSLIELTWQISN